MTSFCWIFMLSRGKRKERGMSSPNVSGWVVAGSKNNSPLPSVQKYTHTCDCETRRAGTNTEYWFKKMEQYLAPAAITLFLIRHRN